MSLNTPPTIRSKALIGYGAEITGLDITGENDIA
jgi:hypothetical protein